MLKLRACVLTVSAKEVTALRSPESVPGVPSISAREVRRLDWILPAVALFLLVVLAIPVGLQNAHILRTAPFASPLHSGSDFAAVVAGVGRSRAQNAMVAIAVHAASSADSHPTVYGPPDLQGLSALPPDEFDGQLTQVLQEPLLQPLIDGNLVKRSYQVRLSDSAIAEFEAQGRLVRFPMDVWAVKPHSGQTVPSVVLHTDAPGKHIVVVPIADSGAVKP